MAITRFQDLPSENSPINSENLNGNFDELGVKVGTSVDNNYRTNIIKSKNLFDKSDVEKSYLNVNNGSVISSNDWNTTQFISLSSNVEHITIIGNKGANEGYCFYDSSKTFINGGSMSTSTSKNITVPSNAEYFRITVSNDVLNSYAIYFNGNTTDSYQPYVPFSMYVDNEKFTETIGVGTSVDSKNKVNVLHSKNLLNYTIPLTTNLGVTTSMSDGKLILDGTTTGNGDFIYTNSKNILLLKAGTYTISATKISGTYQKNNKDTAIYIGKAGDKTILFNLTSSNDYSGTRTIKLTEDTLIYLNIYTNGSGMVLTNLVVGLQIERGSTATDFEIPVTPSINVDGETIYTKGQNEEYSTNETVIGTWNGKPLYRKVIQKDVSANTNETYSLSSLGISNQDIVIINLGESTAHYSSITGASYSPVSYYVSSTDRAHVYVNVYYNLIIQNQNSTDRTYHIVLEYTKTTD